MYGVPLIKTYSNPPPDRNIVKGTTHPVPGIDNLNSIKNLCPNFTITYFAIFAKKTTFGAGFALPQKKLISKAN